MNITVNRLAGVVLAAAVAGLTAQAAVADSHCGAAPKTHKLKVRVENDKPKKVLKEDGSDSPLKVCLGDSVEWKLQGSRKSFDVDFGSRAPFAGTKRRKSASQKIEVQITSGTPGESFKYSVWIGDAELDPRIVIDD